MPEVSESDLLQLRTAYALVKKMEGNPDSKLLLERAAKVVVPDLQTDEEIAARFVAPQAERIDQLTTKIDELTASLAEKDKAVTESATLSQMESAFTRLKGSGYTDDGIEKIKALMVDRKIADPEAAAALFDRQNPAPPQEQPGWVPDTWNLESTAAPGVDVKALFANEDRWADQEAANALNEIRLGKAA